MTYFVGGVELDGSGGQAQRGAAESAGCGVATGLEERSRAGFFLAAIAEKVPVRRAKKRRVGRDDVFHRLGDLYVELGGANRRHALRHDVSEDRRTGLPWRLVGNECLVGKAHDRRVELLCGETAAGGRLTEDDRRRGWRRGAQDFEATHQRGLERRETFADE